MTQSAIVPPASGPHKALPTICVIKTVGRVRKTVCVLGKSVPSVRIFTLIRTCISPFLYISFFLLLSIQHECFRSLFQQKMTMCNPKNFLSLINRIFEQPVCSRQCFSTTCRQYPQRTKRGLCIQLVHRLHCVYLMLIQNAWIFPFAGLTVCAFAFSISVVAIISILPTFNNFVRR